MGFRAIIMEVLYFGFSGRRFKLPQTYCGSIKLTAFKASFFLSVDTLYKVHKKAEWRSRGQYQLDS